MSKDQFKNKWDHYKAKVKQKWNKLTDQDIKEIEGKREHLVGKLQQKYGWDKKRSENELYEFESIHGKNLEKTPHLDYIDEGSSIKPLKFNDKQRLGERDQEGRISQFDQDYFREERGDDKPSDPQKRKRKAS